MVAPTDIAAHVIGPDDPEYDAARRVQRDDRPATAGDRPVPRRARRRGESGTPASTTSCCPSAAAATASRSNAVCDGGIMLDLSGMKDVTVDPAQRIAHARPEAAARELDAATQRHGLATPLGVMSGTGIAGLTLGGGLGWLNARYGLACDNLIGAEVVTAGGDILQVGPDEHPDLLWGCGAAAATSPSSRRSSTGCPVSSVLAGALTHPWAAAREVLRHHHAFMAPHRTS